MITQSRVIPEEPPPPKFFNYIYKPGIPNWVYADPLGVYGSLKGVYDIFYVLKFYFKGM
jgi:hypothetical protein